MAGREARACNCRKAVAASRGRRRAVAVARGGREPRAHASKGHSRRRRVDAAAHAAGRGPAPPLAPPRARAAILCGARCVFCREPRASGPRERHRAGARMPAAEACLRRRRCGRVRLNSGQHAQHLLTPMPRRQLGALFRLHSSRLSRPPAPRWRLVRGVSGKYMRGPSTHLAEYRAFQSAARVQRCPHSHVAGWCAEGQKSPEGRRSARAGA